MSRTPTGGLRIDFPVGYDEDTWGLLYVFVCAQPNVHVAQRVIDRSCEPNSCTSSQTASISATAMADTQSPALDFADGDSQRPELGVLPVPTLGVPGGHARLRRRPKLHAGANRRLRLQVLHRHDDSADQCWHLEPCFPCAPTRAGLALSDIWPVENRLHCIEASWPPPLALCGSSAAEAAAASPPPFCESGGITEEFAATGSCTSPTDCSTQPCTMDVCWDGMGRRQIDDDCCACPEPPIADGNWGNQYHCYNEPCKEDLCWDGNPRREIDGRCCECPLDMWTNDCMPSDGGTPKLCGDKCSHVTSDGITYYGYCDLDLQCQSGLDDYAISTLCGPPVLDGHWGGDPLACVGKPCGAECSLRGQMYGRCASDYTCQPKQEDDWANLGCAKSDGGNDDPMGLCRAFLGDVTSLSQMMGGLMGGGSMGGMSGSGVCQVVGDEGLGLRRRLQTIGRRKLQMTATSAGLPDLPRDALVLAAAEIAGSRPGSAVPGVPPEAMAAAMAALQTSGLDMATITDLVATAASSSGSMPSPGSLASLLPAGLPPIDVAPCVSDVCRAQWEVLVEARRRVQVRRRRVPVLRGVPAVLGAVQRRARARRDRCRPDVCGGGDELCRVAAAHLHGDVGARHRRHPDSFVLGR